MDGDETHALQRHAGVARLLGLQRGEAQRHVGAVAQAAHLLVGTWRLAHLVEQGIAALGVATADERREIDTERGERLLVRLVRQRGDAGSEYHSRGIAIVEQDPARHGAGSLSSTCRLERHRLDHDCRTMKNVAQ